MTTRSERQERDGARRYGGRPTPRSGAGWARKQDVRTATHLIEYKYTDAASYTVKAAYMTGLERNALQDDLLPAIVVELGNKKSYVIIPEPDFYDLIKERDVPAPSSDDAE